MASRGYDSSFLGVDIPLPTFSSELGDDVFRTSGNDGQQWVDYIHYSVATHTKRRQPIVVALNVDQDKIKRASRRKWKVDNRVRDYQLDNAYYRDNAWDRGHLARRSSAAWGNSEDEAQDASDDTMYYTNAVLQHENLNQDEWLALEDWVRFLEDDLTNRISVFSGPIHGDSQVARRFVTPRGREAAEVPAAFFKIVAFIDKQSKLAVRAFIMVQDRLSLSDKNGERSRMFDLKTYQVTVTMIQQDTGLVFPEAIAKANPLFFNPGERPDEVGATRLPEIIPTEGPSDVIPDETTFRPTFTGRSTLFIAAALPNPSGDERKKEWVTISNFGPKVVDLDGWSLSDTTGTALNLSGKLRQGESLRIMPLQDENGSVVLSNRGGVLVLADPRGRSVDRVRFSGSQPEDVPVIFHATV